MRDSSQIGTVQDVDGPTILVALSAEVPVGLIFVLGEPYRVGQVGSFARVAIGFTDLIGIVTRVGAGALRDKQRADQITNEARWLTLELVGEAGEGQSFVRGVSQLPSIGDPVHVVTSTDLEKIYGTDGDDRAYVEIGHVAAAEAIGARLDVNQLVTRHSAIVGSTGSGKSTTVASIIQSIADPAKFASARIVLFDVHGEYARAFKSGANVFTLNPETVPGSERLAVPFWALTFEELIPLVFGNLQDDAGRAFIRDEIARLKREAFSKKASPGLDAADITADSPIPFSIRQLWFDLHVLLNATHTAPGGQSRSTWALKVDSAGTPVEPGDAQRLIPPEFETQTQAAGTTKIYLSTSGLNIRRQVEVLGSRLRDKRFDFTLKPEVWDPDVLGVAKQDLDTLLRAWLGAEQAVTIVDLSGVPATVVSDVVGSMTRVIYDSMFWARNLSEGARERPVLLVFEEAHSYLGTGNDRAAKVAVQRIVREGRKYGVGAMIVSQRPSEIDPTILSQCGTLVAMRLTNSTDRQHISSSAADNMQGVLSMLPVLRTGEAIIVGESVPLPMRALIHKPLSPPDSQDPTLVGIDEPGGWDRAREPSNYEDVSRVWRSQNPRSPEQI
jgi:DNA helicase HerA-like ATPase